MQCMRDAFGIQAAYVSRQGSTNWIASAAQLLAPSDQYDLEYIAELLACGDDFGDRTIYSDVAAVLPASTLTAKGQARHTSTYWSACQFPPSTDRVDSAEAALELRSLIEQSLVRTCSGATNVWSQLSGGLDSSGLVSLASSMYEQGLLERPLSGTVTWDDSLGAGNERAFVDAVLAGHHWQTIRLEDCWMWQSMRSGVVPSDLPYITFPFWTRDRSTAAALKSAGSDVLLSGVGPDHYLGGTSLHLADRVAAGHPIDGLRSAYRWATVKRRSYWKTVWRSMIMPLWRSGRGAARRRQGAYTGDWLDEQFVNAFDLKGRLLEPIGKGRMRWTPGAFEVAYQVDLLWTAIDRGPLSDAVDIRYPYLYRPLVEFVLQLPLALRIQPNQNKWIFREAMRGILPETVRSRPGKGTIGARVRWSLTKEKSFLQQLTAQPILEQLGCISGQRLRETIQQAESCKLRKIVPLIATLSLETWLRTRSDGPAVDDLPPHDLHSIATTVST